MVGYPLLGYDLTFWPIDALFHTVVVQLGNKAQLSAAAALTSSRSGQRRADHPMRFLLSGEILSTLVTALAILFILAHGKLSLEGSDKEAILRVRKDLGFRLPRDDFTHRLSPAIPCTLAGVHCERRRDSRNGSLRVTRIDFDSMGLEGSLSPAIGRLSDLRQLSLPNNRIADRFPQRLAELQKLEILDLSNNRFTGKIPPEFSSLPRLKILDLSSNQFFGNLNFLKHFPNLERLSIAENQFSGRMPPSLRSFRNLRAFNFSGNDFLEGSFSGLRAPSKRYILTEKSKASGSGNRSRPAISPQSSAQGPAAGGAQNRPKKKKKKIKKIVGWILGFTVGAFAGSLSGLACSVLFKLLLVLIQGKKESGPQIYSPFIKKVEDLAFLEREDGLASMEIIGRGGCGEVYRAELPGSEGKVIAIKKILQTVVGAPTPELTEEDSRLLNRKMRQIRSEINTVSRIRHRNLLPLLAHVARPDCHYLVYEYMKNGSLQDVMREVSEGRRRLEWGARLRIAVGVAAGLEYLHTSHSPRIIHRDLKPANVLLDDEMEARIADFGLAKAIPDANTHCTTSNVAGTVGYIAPEYHQTLKFTDKCDVYSFGVLLAVLVVGRLPGDDFFQNTAEVGLVKWLRRAMTSGDPACAVDASLLGDGAEEQMLLVLKIACFCTRDDPKQRPSSKDVRCMLAQIKH